MLADEDEVSLPSVGDPALGMLDDDGELSLSDSEVLAESDPLEVVLRDLSDVGPREERYSLRFSRRLRSFRSFRS